MIYIAYKRCSTCKKIQDLLDEKKIDYVYREIDKENPTAVEIKKWHEESGLDIKKFPDMTDEEKYELLATDGKLVKRPILLDDKKKFVAVGGPGVRKYLEEK